MNKRKFIKLCGLVYIDINSITKFKREGLSIKICISNDLSYQTCINYTSLEQAQDEFKLLVSLFDVINDEVITSFTEFNNNI